MPVIPVSWDAEAGEPLKGRRRMLSEPRSYYCTPDGVVERDSDSKKKTKEKENVHTYIYTHTHVIHTHTHTLVIFLYISIHWYNLNSIVDFI